MDTTEYIPGVISHLRDQPTSVIYFCCGIAVRKLVEKSGDRGEQIWTSGSFWNASDLETAILLIINS